MKQFLTGLTACLLILHWQEKCKINKYAINPVKNSFIIKYSDREYLRHYYYNLL